MKDSRAGFTLIELLVVIGILTLLVTTFAPDIIGMMSRGEKAADKANQQWIYQQILGYQQKRKRFPLHSGHKFVLAPWVENDIEKTPQNFQRFFTPGLMEQDSHVGLLRAENLEQIWRDYDSLTSEDTHYAGRNLKAKMKEGRLISGYEPWLGNDNEFGPAFRDDTIHLCMGDGTIREILQQELVESYGFDPDADEAFPVGPESPHELLQKLER